jgi:hypothetical protein
MTAPTVWIWQFLRSITPATAKAAVSAAGLGDDWIPVVPFAEVAERAVGTIKGAKRTKEPGLIIWEHRGRSWFADLVTEAITFEAPKSKAAKEITGRMEAARDLQPKDLDAYLGDVVTDWGGVQLMGPLWVVPPADGSDMILGMLRGLPGAAVAAIPIEGAAVAGEVLALLAGRLGAEAGAMVTDLDGLRVETLRRRAGILRERAEGVARLAGTFGIDLSTIGDVLTTAEGTIRARLAGQRYAPPLDFSGAVGDHPIDVQSQAVEPDPVPVGDHPLPELQAGEARAPAPTEGATYSKIGDPPPSAPPLKMAKRIKAEV